MLLVSKLLRGGNVLLKVLEVSQPELIKSRYYSRPFGLGAEPCSLGALISILGTSAIYISAFSPRISVKEKIICNKI